MFPRIFRAVLSVLLVTAMTGDLRAQEQQAPPAEEGEVDLKAMLQKVEKLTQERKAGASVEGVAFPFGHFLRVAAPVVRTETPAAKPAEAPSPAGMPEFSITGKMKMGRQMKIFVGRGAYGVGDTVEGAKVVQIKDDEAVFEFGGTTYTKPIP